MKGGYERLVWVNDDEGREFVCSITDSGNVKSYDELSDEEKRTCSNVNQIVGTERW